jgi:hypothetical protein
MGRWTDWMKIADENKCFLDDLKHDGPACYELGVRKNFLGVFRDIEIMYVGETSNEKKRITAYAVDGSHLADLIEDYLDSGYSLYYRAQAKANKKEAKNMQDSLLLSYEYEWNVHNNVLQ